jgi:putative FmdB family regulatory protein
MEQAAPLGSGGSRGYHRLMPIYEFLCGECGIRFEVLVEAGTGSVPCTGCGSGATRRVYSPQRPPMKLVKTRADARKQERKNARLREQAKRRFVEARRRARRPEGTA